MAMNPHGKRFLLLSEFGRYFHSVAEFCREVYSEDMLKKELEFYEKEGLLSPFRRLVKPRAYTRFVNDLKFNPKNPYYGKPQFAFPKNATKSWVSLWQLENEVSLWPWPTAQTKGEILHPFDRNHKLGRYLLNPLTQPFQPWKSYDFKMRLYSTMISVSHVEHYYAYWQIYQLWAVRQGNTLKVISNLQERTNLKNIRHRDWGRVNIARVMTPLVFRQQKQGDFLDINHYFDGLSLFVGVLDSENTVTYGRYGQHLGGKHILQGKSLEDLQHRLHCHAKDTKRKYHFSTDGLYQFLKQLADLYFDIQDAGYIKLSEELRKDIYYLITFMWYTEGHSYDVIVKKVGRLRLQMKDALEVIFPDEFSAAKEESETTLKIHINQFNSSFSNKQVQRSYRLDESNITSLITFFNDRGLDLYFHTIKELNHDWHDSTVFTENKLFTHLRNLASLVEALLKEIGRNALDPTVSHDFQTASRLTLHKCLKFYFKNSWITTLTSGAWVNASWDNTRGISDFEQKLVALVKQTTRFSRSKWHNFVITNWLITGLVRNFTNHELQHSQLLLRDHYAEVIEAIQYCLLFTWAYARSRKHSYLLKQYRKY